MSKYQLTTTMHARGYEQYGRNMIDSFLKHWPENQTLLVYTEGFTVETKDNRIISKDLLACSPDLVAFKKRHQNNPRANGYVTEKQRDPDFKYDAVRFSHKVFALYHAYKNRSADVDSIVWIDADTVTHAPVPKDFLKQHFPLNPEIGIYYLGRLEQYTECGWVVYNCTNPHMETFWERFANQYRKDKLLNQAEWHDSYIFDVVRTTMENEGMINSNITPGYVKGHPFIDSFLGEYMDHLKGPKRKAAGRSAKTEARNKIAGWWQ
jgi:hypothetical protein